MAGDIETKAVDELAETVNTATSEANRTMLRLAAEAVVKPGKAEITHSKASLGRIVTKELRQTA